MFEEGGVVILESKASGKTLRSHHGTLQGVGGRGIFGIKNRPNFIYNS